MRSVEFDASAFEDLAWWIEQDRSLGGDKKTGRAILRNYINATVGFKQLEEATSIPATSLMRMFGPNGNPSAKSLFGVLAHLQKQEGVNFEIRPRRS